MKFKGTIQPTLALFEYERDDLTDRFSIARAKTTERYNNCQILEAYDLQDSSGKHLVGVLFIPEAI